MHFLINIFAHIKKKQYLCDRILKTNIITIRFYSQITTNLLTTKFMPL